jgi:hypothetical protein
LVRITSRVIETMLVEGAQRVPAEKTSDFGPDESIT